MECFFVILYSSYCWLLLVGRYRSRKTLKPNVRVVVHASVLLVVVLCVHLCLQLCFQVESFLEVLREADGTLAENLEKRFPSLKVPT